MEISKTTNKATYAASLFFPQSNASKWLSPSTALTREAIVCYSASRVFNQTPTSLEISDVSCLFFLPHAPHSPRTKYRSLGRCFDSPLARTTQPYCSCSREETPGVKYQPLWSAHHFLSLPRERALTLEIPISGASETHYTIAFLESSGNQRMLAIVFGSVVCFFSGTVFFFFFYQKIITSLSCFVRCLTRLLQ